MAEKTSKPLVDCSPSIKTNFLDWDIHEDLERVK